MLYFEDIEPEALPVQSKFFYDVKVWTILIQQEDTEYLPPDIWEQWYCQDLTSPLPCIIGILRTNLLDPDLEFEVECHPHSVVEISNRQSIAWYMTKRGKS